MDNDSWTEKCPTCGDRLYHEWICDTFLDQISTFDDSENDLTTELSTTEQSEQNDNSEVEPNQNDDPERKTQETRKSIWERRGIFDTTIQVLLDYITSSTKCKSTKTKLSGPVVGKPFVEDLSVRINATTISTQTLLTSKVYPEDACFDLF